MKVSIYQTLEVTNEQRKAIALEIDGEGAKARPATRDEMKKFIWDRGSEWEAFISDEDGVPEDPQQDVDGDAEDADEDLLGDPDLDDLL